MSTKRKNIEVTQEASSGRNVQFYDPTLNRTMSKTDFVKKIESGYYESYHIRKIDSVKTPASNPDNKENNNLG